MARKQLNIPGTARPVHEDIEKAADAYREVRDERMALTKREKQKSLELLALMQAHRVNRYKYDDAEGEELVVMVDEEPKIKVRKTGEVEADVGQGVDDDEPRTPRVSTGADDASKGLIAQALKSQEDAGVEVDGEGDVIPPSGDGKRKPRKAKAKKAK